MLKEKLLLGLLTIVLLGGCGIKPDSVSPPPDAEKDAFPRVYPDAASGLPPYSKDPY